MKKLLVFMAMMTLALGAWAYDYNFTLSVQCPEVFATMSEDGGYYLVNTKTDTVYFYWKGNEWNVEQKSGKTYLSQESDVTHAAVESKTFEIKDKTYYVINQFSESGESTVKNRTSTIPEYKKVIFEHGFTSETELQLSDFGSYDNQTGVYSDLAVIVYDSRLGIDEVYDVGVAITPGDPTVHFTAAGLMTPVPEPTSGMLFLLGLAGLSLRRRRVA